jgi:hypothetical protein
MREPTAMNSRTPLEQPLPREAEQRPTPCYEPPRILAKRAVERVTLFTQVVTPGGGIGEQP